MAEEKSPADWLPPGWTVEVRVRKTGKKDKCYTDPSNGLEFFSKPEVFRYLNNVETNHSKSKGTKKRSRKLSAINSSAVAEPLKLADSRADRQKTTDQGSDLVGVLKDEKILESCTGREEASASCFNLPESMDLEQRENRDPFTDVLGVAPVAGAHSEKLPENGVESSGSNRMQQRLNELKNKSISDLPRRASKRLAGIEVGPIPELKTNNRGRRVSAGHLDDAEDSTARNLLDSAASKECAESRETEDNADKKREGPVPEQHAVLVEAEKKADERPGSPLSLSLNDLWMDPCIEFAIKTLTGAIPVGDENKADENNPGSSLELPFGGSWGDPCIEFAVKTLTGAIPVVDDLGIQDNLQQQLTSSNMGDKDLNFSNL